MKKIATLIAATYLSCASLHSQEQLGIRTSNYGGVNSLLLNPANSHTTPFVWDANLLEFGQFFDNNYAFIENFRLLDLLQNPDGVELRPLLRDANKQPSPKTIVIDFYSDEQKKYATTNTQILGPSLLFRLNEDNVIGFFTRARVAVDARDVPPSLGYYEYNRQPFEEPFLVEPTYGNALTWTEIGLNYARRAYNDYGEMSFGASLKFLQGYEAIYLRNNSNFDLTQLRENRLRGTSVDFNYGFASSGLDAEDWKLQRNGLGIGLDLGFVFSFSEEEGVPYRWKIGASVLDLGTIRFNRAAQKHEVRTNNVQEINLNVYNQFSEVADLDSILRVFSDQLLNDPAASLQATSFAMWLPTALSVQADVNVLPSFFVNATIVQGIPVSKIAMRRSSIAAITPRFEKRWFELAMPISILDWRQLRAGVAARLGFLWFGTEDFKSVFQKSEFNSTDFYMAIKINPFSLNKKEKDHSSGWQGRGNNRLKTKGNGDVKCPKF
ncbi:MAG: hypothetical protein IPJ74_02460 [Saprospiraceae bacterium]|nr:hypothetical protein [Saprospiraceae bacterium]